ncbi:MAG: hypothetical protein FJ146_19255 [Deltaproteobacteria bacterium]|nr:hypothetical protein [Deltaproteobacteria bacterium]
MGARTKTNKAELMVSRRKFFDRVGVVTNFYELELLGLAGHDFCGLCIKSLLPQLIKFTEINPEYHIVSSVGVGRFANRYCEDADAYLIANGDRDPLIEVNYLLDPLWPVIWEDGMAAAIAEINNIKNGRKS